MSRDLDTERVALRAEADRLRRLAASRADVIAQLERDIVAKEALMQDLQQQRSALQTEADQLRESAGKTARLEREVEAQEARLRAQARGHDEAVHSMIEDPLQTVKPQNVLEGLPREDPHAGIGYSPIALLSLGQREC